MKWNDSGSGNVKSVLEEAVRARIGSGMAAAWGSFDDPGSVHRMYLGRESHFGDSVVCPRTVFDLASLTKILATTTLYMKWHDQGVMDLDASYAGKPFTFRHLLNHSSGLPAWKPFYEQMIARFVGVDAVRNPGSAIGANRVLNISGGASEGFSAISIQERQAYFDALILAETPIAKPGEKIIYSDIGFSLLMIHAERISGMPFDELIRSEVWNGIPECGLHFRQLHRNQRVSSGIAASEWCAWRGLLQGDVHDDNAWSRGGVAGHAGAFGSLDDVIRWMNALVNGKLVSFNTLREFSMPFIDSSGARRGLGFDFSSHPVHSSATIGHLGFTGTSIWMDLDRGRFAILLTNRVHPSREDTRIRELRQAFHQTVG